MLRAALLLLLAGRRAAAGAGNSAWRVPTAEIAGGDLTKLQYFAGALSPAECAAVRGLAGREQKAGIATDGGDVSRTKVRSTDLRWLARGEETEWLYERMLALAEAAKPVGADALRGTAAEEQTTSVSVSRSRRVGSGCCEIERPCRA